MNDFQSFQPFQPYLFRSERIVWSGQPKQGLALSGRDTFLIPFSLMWGGFAIFWNAGVWGGVDGGRAAPFFFRLWGLPFLVVGIYLIVGRFIHDASLRKKLFYAVTDQRILILRGSKITSLDIHRLPRLELTEHSDGTGTIAFEADMAFGSGRNGFGYWVPALSSSAQFFRVDNPRRVYELIRNQAQS
jgi:hypothetical protein